MFKNNYTLQMQQIELLKLRICQINVETSPINAKINLTSAIYKEYNDKKIAMCI